MDNNDLKNNIVIGIVIILIVLIGVGGIVEANRISASHDLNMAKAGYELKTVPGVSGVHWTKTAKPTPEKE